MGDVNRHDEIQGEIIHEYDGIEEADNNLPRWWLLTFYGAIVFAIGYWFYYHEYEMGPSQAEVFAAEMSERAAQGTADADTLVMLSQDESTVEEGRQAFAGTCAACHGDQGQGEIGPNLTDDRWLHGGGPEQIYTSIREGISADQAKLPGSAGMPAWGQTLGERPVQALTAYLLSVRDTNVPGGREPEGEVYDPSAAPATEEGTAEEAPAAPGESAEAPAPEEAAEPTQPTGVATQPGSDGRGA
jgi:cytochrome c oxidase cbb3-type subunit 3